MPNAVRGRLIVATSDALRAQCALACNLRPQEWMPAGWGWRMSGKSSPGSRRTRKSVTVRAAWIGGGCVVAAAIITAVLPTMLHDSSSGPSSSAASSVSPVPSATSTVSDGPLVAVRREAGVSGGCGSWIVPKAPQDVSSVGSSTDWEAWVAQNQAIDATRAAFWSHANTGQNDAVTNLDVTVQGRSSVQIILTGIQFVVVRRGSAPIKGGLVTRACGGPMEARYMVVDLDSRPAQIITSVPDPFPPPPGEPWQGTPVRFPYYVTNTNGEVFKIIAYTHSDVTWYAELFWSVDGKNGQSIISDGSKPFETAVSSRAAAVYGYNGHGWYVCSKSSPSESSISECAVNY